MFIARERELAILEECYQADGLQMVPVWGRRRVGKTKLLNEFARNKERVHFFTARRTTARENLAALSAALQTWYDPDAPEQGADEGLPVYSSFEAALSRAFSEAQNKRTILVIDEYPYLAESYAGVSSLLQGLIDTNQSRSALMLVLCGSSMSFMEHQVLGEKSPLYGRRTAQLKVEPFDYFDSARLMGCSDPVRAVELYSMVGGVPLYLEQLDSAHTTEWNIANRLLGSGRFLYAEPANFLLQEVSSPAPYTAVVDAVAHGRVRPVEIADATGIQGPNVNEHLRKLGELGVVRRDTPVGKANKKQVVYRISDNLFSFWHTFVPRYAQAIELGREREVAKRIVDRDLATYVGHTFEEVCRQWLARQISSGNINILPSQIGSWWGTDPIARTSTDVDVVALGSEGEVVCGECKWQTNPVGSDVVETLHIRSRLVAESPIDVHLYVFSKAGFADSARREADRLGNVTLLGVEELFEP